MGTYPFSGDLWEVNLSRKRIVEVHPKTEDNCWRLSQVRGDSWNVIQSVEICGKFPFVSEKISLSQRGFVGCYSQSEESCGRLLSSEKICG